MLSKEIVQSLCCLELQWTYHRERRGIQQDRVLDVPITCIWLHCKRKENLYKYWRTNEHVKSMLSDHWEEVEYAVKDCLIIFHMLHVIRVLGNLKDYAVKVLVNVVDHLGIVGYKLTDLYEQQEMIGAATINRKHIVPCRICVIKM